jgi:hypothetical protein
MSLTTIPLNHIFFLAKLFCKERLSRKQKQGHPLTYPLVMGQVLDMVVIASLDGIVGW